MFIAFVPQLLALHPRLCNIGTECWARCLRSHDINAHALSQGGACSASQQASFVAAVSFLVAAASLKTFVSAVGRLTKVLSPCRAACDAPPAHISWVLVWSAVLVEQALTPAALFMTWFSPEIEWSGVRYRKANGRVRVVARGLAPSKVWPKVWPAQRYAHDTTRPPPCHVLLLARLGCGVQRAGRLRDGTG